MRELKDRFSTSPTVRGIGRTWAELEDEGVLRCRAMLVDRATGKTEQCRRRASDSSPSGCYCKRHEFINTIDRSESWQ